MSKLIGYRYLIRQNLVLLIGLCLSFYFCYHLLAGPRSYLRLMSLENQISSVTQDYQQVKAQRSALERKVIMMRPGSIDRDLLEEQARKALGYRYEGELVIMQGQGTPS